MLDRKTPPRFNRSLSFDLISPIVKKLANGIEIFFIPGGQQDVMKVELVFKAGRWYEHFSGAGYFSSHLLPKGTAQKSSFEIAEHFDQLGAHLEISPGLDVVSISLYALTQTAEKALKLLMEVLKEATFPEKEIEQSKSIYIQNLKVNNEKTSFQASKLFRKNLFGETHPYGKELEELEVQDLTRIQLTGHRDEFMQDVVVFASGKLDDKVQQLLIDEFSSWKTRPVAPKGITAGDHKLFHEYTEKEGSVQSSVRIGKKSLQRTHADYVEVLLLSHILGGYFGSRLMKNIREEKGLTYGIHASIHALQQDSYMLIGADVNKENVTVTFDEVRKELKRLRTEKIADDELEIARNHFIGSLQSELTTPFAHADKIRTIKLFGLPENYYQIMISKLDRTTSEDLIQIGEKHFHEESFSDAAVG